MIIDVIIFYYKYEVGICKFWKGSKEYSLAFPKLFHSKDLEKLSEELNKFPLF